VDDRTLTTEILALLQDVVDREAAHDPVQVSATSALIGPDATISSLGAVSLIADVEITLAENYGLEVMLVSEDALSRSKSPFLTVETLVDYIGELAQR